MQDNIVYKLELTAEEYEYVENLKKEYYKKLSQMTKKERLQYFRDNYCNEQKLNFEKEINGTIYKVNTHFDENAEESILNKFFRLTKKSWESLEVLKRIWYYVNTTTKTL
mgnify:FL=1